MAASSLPSTTAGLIQLQAQQATELHNITMEKARAELAILRGKATAAPVTEEDPTAAYFTLPGRFHLCSPSS